jgi:hypothetical protein
MGVGSHKLQGLTALAINCRPSGAQEESPEGATVNSQGRQPLEGVVYPDSLRASSRGPA